MDRYEFKVKFDSERELFVLLVRLSSQRFQERVSEYFEAANVVFAEPYEFQVCIPVNAIPDQFCALTAQLPSGVKLCEIKFDNPSACFVFSFTEAALLEVTPPLYRHWIKSVTQAGYFADLFVRL